MNTEVATSPTVFSTRLLKIILINVFLLSIQNSLHQYLSITVSQSGSGRHYQLRPLKMTTELCNSFILTENHQG